jgi:hypothetical protein
MFAMRLRPAPGVFGVVAGVSAMGPRGPPATALDADRPGFPCRRRTHDTDAARAGLLAETPTRYRDCVRALPASVVAELDYIRVVYDAKPLSGPQKTRMRRAVLRIINDHIGALAGPWPDRELEYFADVLERYECL